MLNDSCRFQQGGEPFLCAQGASRVGDHLYVLRVPAEWETTFMCLGCHKKFVYTKCVCFKDTQCVCFKNTQRVCFKDTLCACCKTAQCLSFNNVFVSKIHNVKRAYLLEITILSSIFQMHPYRYLDGIIIFVLIIKLLTLIYY